MTDAIPLTPEARHKPPRTLAVTLIALLSLALATITFLTGIELLIDPHGWVLRWSMYWLDRLGFIPHTSSGALPGTPMLFGAMMLYTVIFVLEGGGMLLGYAWAEYLVLVELGLLLPPEIMENFQQTDWLRLATLIFNLGIFVYLGYRRMQALWLARRISS